VSAEGNGSKDSIFHIAEHYIGERVTVAVAQIDVGVVSRAVDILLRAPATFVYGAGRSGIIGRAFAMRLVQAGLTAYVIGESVTPIVRRGDAVFILSYQGESYSSMQTANIVRREGADLVVITGRSTSKLAHAASLLMHLDITSEPARPDLAPLGTLFESASLRLTDALIAEILRRRGETEDSMRRRHAIMV
jgi:6-phospho-3-hexuloisomerase